MVLCDTNIFIELYKGNAAVIHQLHEIGASNIAVSVVTKAELFYGARGKQELVRIRKHLELLQCYPVNELDSALFIRLIQEYSLSHKSSIPDMLIAATAINHDLELYTLNSKDFKFIPAIKLYRSDI